MFKYSEDIRVHSFESSGWSRGRHDSYLKFSNLLLFLVSFIEKNLSGWITISEARVKVKYVSYRTVGYIKPYVQVTFKLY